MEPQLSDVWLPTGVHREPNTERPFYTFLLKVAARCNLDCTYCYVYSGPDQSWRDRPRFMSREVASRAAEAIATHVDKHGVSDIVVVFHGGEPLLAGPERLDEYCRLVRSIVPAKVEFGVQTNATLLSPEILRVLETHDVRIGISIDGSQSANDAHRRFVNGRSSYARVVQGINLLRSRPEWNRLFGGFLAVIDLQNDPSAVYEALVSLGARSLDVLLPDSHHDAPPPRPLGKAGRVAYGRWLSRLFDTWLDSQQNIEIRYFEEIIALLLGGRSSLESIGAKSVDLIVIESDGDIEAVDTLKMVGRHVTDLGLNIFKNSLDDALAHPAVHSRMLGFKALCATCQSCSEVNYCGGGYLPHRYGRGNGFVNPSTYCDDLKYLISHVRDRIRSPLTSAMQQMKVS